MEETELVDRASQGDFEAFEALYCLYKDRALHTAFLITRSVSESEDAVQETFVQVWRRICSLRNSMSFRPWFYRILINESRRVGKRRWWNRASPFPEPGVDHPDIVTLLPEEQVERAESAAQVKAAIAALRAAQRIPVVLRYYNGLSEAEIGEILEIPPGTVKSRLYYARQAIHQMLTKVDADRRKLSKGFEKEGPCNDR